MDWLKATGYRLLIGVMLVLTFTSALLWGQESIPKICIVVGASGEPEYGTMFEQWGSDWSTAVDGMRYLAIGQGESNKTDQPADLVSDRDRVKNWIDSVELVEQAGTYWLILMGHGTYDGKSAKFNLRGADLSSQELGSWLSRSKHRWVIAVCSSSSGPFMSSLSAPGRVVITATKSGAESNFSRFGGFLAQSIRDLNSDLDHDQTISVLEAFLSAARSTARYFEEKKLLATEHAMLDDNGDGKGTTVEFYRGIRPLKKSDNGIVDGELARTIRLRDSKGSDSLDAESRTRVAALESEIESVRAKKHSMDEAEYYLELERLLIELARIFYPASR
jgi:hypothetical protein